MRPSTKFFGALTCVLFAGVSLASWKLPMSLDYEFPSMGEMPAGNCVTAGPRTHFRRGVGSVPADIESVAGLHVEIYEKLTDCGLSSPPG